MYVNPFTGSKTKVTQRLLEGEVEMENFNHLEKEDENERFILFTDGTLIRKVESEKKYFPNRF